MSTGFGFSQEDRQKGIGGDTPAPNWLFAGPLSVISQRYAVVQLGSLQLDGQGRLAQVQSGGLGQKAHTPIDPMIQRLLPVERIALAF